MALCVFKVQVRASCINFSKISSILMVLYIFCIYICKSMQIPSTLINTILVSKLLYKL